MNRKICLFESHYCNCLDIHKIIKRIIQRDIFRLTHPRPGHCPGCSWATSRCPRPPPSAPDSRPRPGAASCWSPGTRSTWGGPWAWPPPWDSWASPSPSSAGQRSVGREYPGPGWGLQHWGIRKLWWWENGNESDSFPVFFIHYYACLCNQL